MAKYKTGLNSIGLDKWNGTKLANNEKLVDTSGFVPLRIRLKKLDMAAAAAKLSRSQFDYHEYEELYDNDIVFDRFDDVEEIQDKLNLFQERKNEILNRKIESYYESHPDEKAALIARNEERRRQYVQDLEKRTTIQQNQQNVENTQQNTSENKI